MADSPLRYLQRKSLLLFLALFLCCIAAGNAATTYSVSYADPSGPYSSYYPAITANIKAAGALWDKELNGSGSLEIQVQIDSSISTANGSSQTSTFVRTEGARNVYEQSATTEVRTGIDQNGALPDIIFRISPTYLTTYLWLDPNPTLRTDPIPANQIDGLSVFIHELGHAFAFTGWMDGTSGALPATYMSTFDAHVTFDGTNFYFTGAKAVARYGGSVPITFGDAFHLGNNSPRPGSDLIPDLMNGVVYNYQTRYTISALDLAIAQDTGITLSPVSSTKVLSLGGSMAFGKATKGSKKTLNLLIRNTGNSPLAISKIKFPVGFSGKFSGTIAAGMSKKVAVTFKPTKVGNYRGTLRVYSNKTSGTNTKGLTGQGK